MNPFKTSIISGLSKNNERKSVQKKDQSNLMSLINGYQSFTSQTNKSSKISQKQDKLMKKLINLEVNLIRKINELKSQKIAVLQEYNMEYDKFTLLTLKFNNLPLSYNNENQLPNMQQKDEKYLKEQKKLKQVLQELYETIQLNNTQESKLNLNQLQQLSNLINLHSQIYNKNIHSNVHTQYTQKYQYSAKKQQNKIDQETLTQQILMLRQAIYNHLPKRLSLLQSQQKMLKNFQKQSRNNVESLIKQKTFVQKQILSLNKLLKEYNQRYQMHKSQQIIKPNEIEANEWIKKYDKINEYQQLKAEHKKLSQMVKNNEKVMQNENIRSLKQKIHGVNDKPQVRVNETEITKNQQLKESGQIEINKLEQEVRRYEEHLESQNQEKIELFKEIKQKQQQYIEIKRQNQIMSILLKIIN